LGLETQNTAVLELGMESATVKTLLVCGSRDWTDHLRIWNYLIDVRAGFGEMRLIHGACRGADTLAGEIGAKIGYVVQAYPADWKKHGRRAGPIRNAQMLAEGKPDFVVAFATKLSGGTWDMVLKARKARLNVTIVRPRNLGNGPGGSGPG